jgi:hypothetical protein
MKMAIMLGTALGHEYDRNSTHHALLSSIGSRRLAEQLVKISNDWRCAENSGAPRSWTQERRQSALLEINGGPGRGDLCRDPQNREYFCPVTCELSDALPFCVITRGGLKRPCRLQQGEAGHPRCVFSDEELADDSIKRHSLLQYHPATSSHGDVCRDSTSDDFFCPSACTHVPRVPYCASEGGHPCRVSRVSNGTVATASGENERIGAITHKIAASSREVSIAPEQAKKTNRPVSTPIASSVSSAPKSRGESQLASHVFGGTAAGFRPLPSRSNVAVLVNSSAPPQEGHICYFFHVPKAAGTTVERIFVRTRKMKTLPGGDKDDLAYLERFASPPQYSFIRPCLNHYFSFPFLNAGVKHSKGT